MTASAREPREPGASQPEPPEPPEPGASVPQSREPGPPEPGPPEPGASEPGASELGDAAQTYEEAAARIEQIIRRLDSGEASLNETLELVREGKGLIELCASELQAVAGALEELRLEELVERLEGQVPD
jgi:exodeoxyribonuclease VII small subunit